MKLHFQRTFSLLLSLTLVLSLGSVPGVAATSSVSASNVAAGKSVAFFGGDQLTTDGDYDTAAVTAGLSVF